MSWLKDSIRAFFQKGDTVLLALCLITSGYGLVLIYSASRYLHTNRYVLVQFVAIMLGTVVHMWIWNCLQKNPGNCFWDSM